MGDAMESVQTWLNKAETYLLQDSAILGDLDTVTILIEKHKLFQQEVLGRRNMVASILNNPDSQVSIGQREGLKEVWEKVRMLTEEREHKLQESFTLAETFNDAIQVVKDWLPDAEAELKFHAISNDEDSIMQLIENHERFQEELQAQQLNIDKIKDLAEEILSSCHQNAVRFVKYYLTVTQTRWEQAVSRSNQRSIKLHDALQTVRANACSLQELTVSLKEDHWLLMTKEKDALPQDLNLLQTLSKEHLDFHEELLNKAKDIDRVVKSFTAGCPSSAEKRTSSGKRGRKPLLNEGESMTLKTLALQKKWKIVLKLSTDRKKRLQDALSQILELEQCRNLDFETWRQSYISWNRKHKLKFMHFFRKQDRHGTGLLTKKEFIDGIMASKFPTNETELIVIFNLFDSKRLGRIQYKTFVDAIMKPDRQLNSSSSSSRIDSGSRYMSPAAVKQQALHQQAESKKIEADIEESVCKCRCKNTFKYFRISEDKYKFGEKEKLSTVRLMNSSVFVRFGSSWMPLEEFMCNNDPCKMKSRPSSRSAKLSFSKSSTKLNQSNNDNKINFRSFSNINIDDSNYSLSPKNIPFNNNTRAKKNTPTNKNISINKNTVNNNTSAHNFNNNNNSITSANNTTSNNTTSSNTTSNNTTSNNTTSNNTSENSNFSSPSIRSNMSNTNIFNNSTNSNNNSINSCNNNINNNNINNNNIITSNNNKNSLNNHNICSSNNNNILDFNNKSPLNRQRLYSTDSERNDFYHNNNTGINKLIINQKKPINNSINTNNDFNNINKSNSSNNNNYIFNKINLKTRNILKLDIITQPNQTHLTSTPLNRPHNKNHNNNNNINYNTNNSNNNNKIPNNNGENNNLKINNQINETSINNKSNNSIENHSNKNKVNENITKSVATTRLERTRQALFSRPSSTYASLHTYTDSPGVYNNRQRFNNEVRAVNNNNNNNNRNQGNNNNGNYGNNNNGEERRMQRNKKNISYLACSSRDEEEVCDIVTKDYRCNDDDNGVDEGDDVVDEGDDGVGGGGDEGSGGGGGDDGGGEGDYGVGDEGGGGDDDGGEGDDGDNYKIEDNYFHSDEKINTKDVFKKIINKHGYGDNTCMSNNTNVTDNTANNNNYDDVDDEVDEYDNGVTIEQSNKVHEECNYFNNDDYVGEGIDRYINDDDDIDGEEDIYVNNDDYYDVKDDYDDKAYGKANVYGDTSDHIDDVYNDEVEQQDLQYSHNMIKHGVKKGDVVDGDGCIDRYHGDHGESCEDRQE